MTTPKLSTASESVSYWRVALRFYAKAAFLQSAIGWAPGLVVPPLLWVLHIRHSPFRAVLAAMAFGVGIGAAFFVGMLGTAIGYDLRRNWRQSDPTVEWNPIWFWKLFLYAGSLMIFAFTVLSIRRSSWFGIEFGFFAILSWFVARSIASTVRLPRSTIPLEDQASSERVRHGLRHKHWGGGHLHPGFVAMEYFALILNRSFLVFITDEGLRCWKFYGLVSSLEPLFYEPVEALLDDPDMTPGSEPFEELMHQRHTFSIPYAEIGSVAFVGRQKWGMGPVPHTGRLRIRSRPPREFILLGNAHGQLICDMIASRIPPG